MRRRVSSCWGRRRSEPSSASHFEIRRQHSVVVVERLGGPVGVLDLHEFKVMQGGKGARASGATHPLISAVIPVAFTGHGAWVRHHQGEVSHSQRAAPACVLMACALAYWITLSARCSSDAGIVMPRALAVLS